MADVTEAVPQPRRAAAEAEVAVSQETLSAIVDGGVATGDALAVAELAGVMGGKRTADLLPLVHQTPLTNLLVQAVPDRAAGAIRIHAETAATAAADVEMEALTAAAVAALALCDMVRGRDRSVEVRSLRLVSAGGGESRWQRPDEEPAHRAEKPDRMAGRGPNRGR